MARPGDDRRGANPGRKAIRTWTPAASPRPGAVDQVAAVSGAPKALMPSSQLQAPAAGRRADSAAQRGAATGSRVWKCR